MIVLILHDGIQQPFKSFAHSRSAREIDLLFGIVRDVGQPEEHKTERNKNYARRNKPEHKHCLAETIIGQRCNDQGDESYQQQVSPDVALGDLIGMPDGKDEIDDVKERPVKRQGPPWSAQERVGIPRTVGEAMVKDVGPTKQAQVDIGGHQKNGELSKRIVEPDVNRNCAMDSVVNDA